MNVPSFKVACDFLKKLTGKDYSALPIVDKLPEHLQSPMVSQYKLWVIAEASREGKKLTKGYWPYFWLDRADPSGFGFSSDDWTLSNACTIVGSRLEYPDAETAIYSGKKHLKLYKDVMTIQETPDLKTK